MLFIGPQKTWDALLILNGQTVNFKLWLVFSSWIIEILIFSFYLFIYSYIAKVLSEFEFKTIDM